MPLSGTIEDVSVVDVLQFLHVSQSSGTATFSMSGSEARVVFHRGRIVAARSTQLDESIGTVLVRKHGVGSDAVRAALEQQERGDPRPLGAILVDVGHVTTEQVTAALTWLVEQVVHDIVVWQSGYFTFQPNQQDAVDNFSYVPQEIAGELGVDVQFMLLDALRVIDERRSAQQVAPPEPVEPPAASVLAPQPAVPHEPENADVDRVVSHLGSDGFGAQPKTVVILVGVDAITKASILERWASDRLTVRVCSLPHQLRGAIREARAAGQRPIILAGVARGEEQGALVRYLTSTRSELGLPPVVVVATQPTDEARRDLARLGMGPVLAGPALRVSPDERAVFMEDLWIITCGVIEEEARRRVLEDYREHEIAGLVSRVRRFRESMESSSVSLALLEYVAENVERAILLLRRRYDAIAIGAFGLDSSRRQLSDLVVGMKLSLDFPGPVLEALEVGDPYRGSVAEVELLRPLFERIGSPVTDNGIIVPVRSIDRVFAILYGDNGASPRPLVSTDALHVLACQAGLILENIALRRMP